MKTNDSDFTEITKAEFEVALGGLRKMMYKFLPHEGIHWEYYRDLCNEIDNIIKSRNSQS